MLMQIWERYVALNQRAFLGLRDFLMVTPAQREQERLKASQIATQRLERATQGSPEQWIADAEAKAVREHHENQESLPWRT